MYKNILYYCISIIILSISLIIEVNYISYISKIPLIFVMYFLLQSIFDCFSFLEKKQLHPFQ